jgi:uncharacterized protein
MDDSAALAAATPVRDDERIQTLDILRGAALLGILLMNILAFGLPMAAYSNPTIAGGSTGPNLWAWILQWILFEGKMRGIFSIMFGAGIYLLTSRVEARGGPAADIHFRRSLWLMLFGIVHSFAIWWGDILFPYALMALVAFPFRKLSTRGLWIIIAIQFTVMTAGMLFDNHSTRELRDKAEAIEKKAAGGAKLTTEETDTQKEWADKKKELYPDKEKLDKEIKAHQGSYIDARKYEAKQVMGFHAMPIYSPYQWDVLGMIFLGFVLIRTGVLGGERPTGFYAKLAASGYLVGIAIGAWTVWGMIAVKFDPLNSGPYFAAYEIQRLAVTLAHISLLVLITRVAMFRPLTNTLAAVGKMAFSNYIATSLICTTIFYGYGFGLYAKLERHQLYYVVAGVWAINLIWSPLWLRSFRFGPLEWCWRSLTYWQRQPMRLATQTVEPVTADGEIAKAATVE